MGIFGLLLYDKDIPLYQRDKGSVWHISRVGNQFFLGEFIKIAYGYIWRYLGEMPFYFIRMSYGLGRIYWCIENDMLSFSIVLV